MDYRNKFYGILRKMGNSCSNCDCVDRIFYMGDVCCIKDLFNELSYSSPFEYEEIYIKWYHKWEDTYNELYS